MIFKASLKEVLLKANELPWDHDLYLNQGDNISIDSPAIVINDDEVESIELENMKYIIGISSIQGVVENIRQQVNSPNLNQLFEAFEYYIENDAFINVV
jgi:hypothetical protein